MEAFALYLFKSVVWLTGFALVYLLFLRNERYFVLNRIYLVAGIVASILFPFFTWHYTIIIPFTPSVEVSDLQMTGIVSEPETFPAKTMLLYAYLAGALYLLYRIIRQTITVIGVIRKSEILPYRSAKLIRTAKYPSSFSFFSFVFVNPSSPETETREIVNHEMEHIRQRHWIDLLLFELLCTLQWLNPMVWLYGRFIRQNHEFLADQRALQRTQNPAIYRAALINQLFGCEVISLANSFHYSINKKRFHMMKNTIHPPYRKLKLLVILPLIAAVFYAFATPEYRYANGDKDQKPNYSITQDKVEIPFTNQLTKADLEAIKADLANVGMKIDYTSLEFTNEGQLKGISAKVTSETGSVSWNTKEISANGYPVFKKAPTGEFGIYFSTVINGTVYKEDGTPLPRAAVVVNGANASVGTITDESGQFELNGIALNENIVISHVGYQSVEVKAEAGKKYVINMKPVNIGMNEVTVTALGSNSGQSSLGSSIKLQSNSPLKFGSKDGAQPLIVIDGVITENQNVNNIPPETIESISVLKNESATRLYGDKGKNGVILISLKKDTPNSTDNTTQKHTYTGIQFRCTDGSIIEDPLIIIDGKISDNQTFMDLPRDGISIFNAINIESAISKYGDKGKKGAVEITTKKGTSQDRATSSNILWNSKKDKIYSEVEVMPEFPGGDAALRQFIASNVRYPKEAMVNGIQGKVFVTFVVDKTGKIPEARIVRGIDPSLDHEALRVINSMPLWKPGKQGGEDVNVEYTIPINFVLDKGKTDAASAKDNDTPYTIVEQMPEFPGGDLALRKFLAYNIKYPKSAVDNGIQGKVFVGFVVDKTGKVKDAKIVRGVDPSLDQEGLRVVMLMPLWKPGKQGGEDVSVEYTIPINFVLEKGKINAPSAKDNSEPYTIVEQMPEYPGGLEALKAYLAANIKYPAEAHQKGIQGKVFVSFVVTKTGSVSNPKVVRGVDPLLDQEAVRVVQSMPTWIPGKQNGETVDVAYTIPINFVLEKKAQLQADPSAQKGKLIIVPNPTQSQATVTLEGSDYSGKLEVVVFDSYGKLMLKESKNGPSFTLSVSTLTPGTYVVATYDGNIQYQGSLVVNH